MCFSLRLLLVALRLNTMKAVLSVVEGDGVNNRRSVVIETRKRLGRRLFQPLPFTVVSFSFFLKFYFGVIFWVVGGNGGVGFEMFQLYCW